MSRNRAGPFDWIAALALICLLPGLAGCAPEEDRTDLDFNFAMPESWDVVSIQRLNTDGDDQDEREWVILYTFDAPPNKAFAPVRCAVYHIVRREPKLPIVYPYHLQAPGWTYLGQGTSRTSVRIQDVVTRITLDPRVHAAANEVIVLSTDADQFVTRASIYQWRDNVQNKHIDPNEVVLYSDAGPQQGQWYQCIGFFEGSQVNIGQDSVAVWQRLNDRSQLARVLEYAPTDPTGGYLMANNELVAPTSTCLEFAYGQPGNLEASPYPEKIVMAFLRTWTTAPDYGSTYLTQAARDVRSIEQSGYWEYFQPDAPLSKACVIELAYSPDVEAQVQVQIQAQAQTQTPRAEPAESTTVVDSRLVVWNDQQRVELRANWELVKQGDDTQNATNQTDVWRINRLLSVRPVE